MAASSSSSKPVDGFLSGVVDEKTEIVLSQASVHSTEEGEILPMSGYLHLDYSFSDPDDARVVNRATNEWKKLPHKGPWTLESDDDGYVCIVGPRPEDNVLAEKFLSRQLVRAPGDPLVIVKFDAEGNKIDEFSLTSKLAQARAVDIFVRSVTLNQWSTLQAWMTPWPRGGMRYAWSAHSIYKVLGLVSYKKEPSKWAKYI